MKLSCLCLALYFLWSPMSLAAARPGGGTPKEQAQWELLYLYGFLATTVEAAGGAAGAAAWHHSTNGVRAWTVARTVAGLAAWETAGSAVRMAVWDDAWDSTRMTSGKASRTATEATYSFTTAGASGMSTQAIGMKAAKVAWLAVLNEKKGILQAIQDRVVRLSFLDPEAVGWTEVRGDLQKVTTTASFQGSLSEVQIFFKLATLRIAYLTEDDAQQAELLRTQFLAHPLIAHHLAKRKALLRQTLLSMSFQPGVEDIVLAYDDCVSFQDLLTILQRTLFPEKTDYRPHTQDLYCVIL